MLIYLQTDVLLLADIYESFRKMCLNYYELDPSNYISCPNLSWDAMLLKTGISIDLITDVDMLQMFEKMKRGGLTFVGSKRLAVANNKYLANYDKTKESTYIINVDANNLYGGAMSEPLPHKYLQFININSETEKYD